MVHFQDSLIPIPMQIPPVLSTSINIIFMLPSTWPVQFHRWNNTTSHRHRELEKYLLHLLLMHHAPVPPGLLFYTVESFCHHPLVGYTNKFIFVYGSHHALLQYPKPNVSDCLISTIPPFIHLGSASVCLSLAILNKSIGLNK